MCRETPVRDDYRYGGTMEESPKAGTKAKAGRDLAGGTKKEDIARKRVIDSSLRSKRRRTEATKDEARKS